MSKETSETPIPTNKQSSNLNSAKKPSETSSISPNPGVNGNPTATQSTPQKPITQSKPISPVPSPKRTPPTGPKSLESHASALIATQKLALIPTASPIPTQIQNLSTKPNPVSMTSSTPKPSLTVTDSLKPMESPKKSENLTPKISLSLTAAPISSPTSLQSSTLTSKTESTSSQNLLPSNKVAKAPAETSPIRTSSSSPTVLEKNPAQDQPNNSVSATVAQDNHNLKKDLHTLTCMIDSKDEKYKTDTNKLIAEINVLQIKIKTLLDQLKKTENTNNLPSALPIQATSNHKIQTIQLKHWIEFKTFAAESHFSAYTCREDERLFEINAVKNNQLLVYIGETPKINEMLRSWLSNQLIVSQEKIVEGTIEL